MYMDDPEYMEQNVELASLSPKKLLAGATPRLIDEWQLAPQLWDTARFEVDHRDEEGQFIFTGSAVPTDTDKIHHSGTGRFAWLTMRTMSLYESGESTGEVSLGDLFSKPGVDIFGTNNLNIDSIAWLICRGGWPKATTINKEVALDMAYRYYEAVVNNDISRVDNVKRDTERAKRILRSIARNQCAQISVNTICADIENNDTASANRLTIASYIEALKKMIEIKLGGEKNIEEGAKNLKRLAAKIDTTKMKAPSFLMILTGTTKYAIRREDGVYVVPIGCLKD